MQDSQGAGVLRRLWYYAHYAIIKITKGQTQLPSTSTKLNATEKQAWLAYCQSQSLSESNALRKLISTAIDLELIPIQKEPKSGKITLRLKPEDFQSMTERATQEGFPSRTNWASQVLLTTLYQSPVLTETEINTLREANRELAAIGRNLNQITKVLNSDSSEKDLLTIKAILMLSHRIERHREQVSALIDKSQNRW